MEYFDKALFGGHIRVCLQILHVLEGDFLVAPGVGEDGVMSVRHLRPGELVEFERLGLDEPHFDAGEVVDVFLDA